VADPKDVPGAVERLLERQRALEAELKAVRTQAASGDARSLAAAAVAGAVVARRDGLPPDQLRDLALAVRNEPGVWAVVLVGTPDGTRVTLVAAVEPGGDLAAPALLAEPARQVGGGGGGRGDVAQAGGKDVAGIDAALAAARAGLGIA